MEIGEFSTRGGLWVVERRLRRIGPFDSARRTATATWPFAKLRVAREQVTISSVLREPFVVTHANVISITLFDQIPALGRGLRFEARNDDDAVVFWTYRRSRIVGELAVVGWTVSERPE
jgi:hypothetical protein